MALKVLITQPRGKEKLLEAFKTAGAELVSPSGSYMEPQLIVPLVDEELPTLAFLKPFFKEKGVTVAVSGEYAVNICRDKAEFYRFCRRHEFGTPVTSQFEGIVKPRFGKGSRGQMLIDRSYIVQEIVKWPEYSIDYFKYGDVLSVIPRLRQNVVNGESKAGTIIYDERLINEATRLGSELGLEFHNVMQCFYDGSSIKWIEVNCRYGGGSWISFAAFNSPKFLVESVR